MPGKKFDAFKCVEGPSGLPGELISHTELDRVIEAYIIISGKQGAGNQDRRHKKAESRDALPEVERDESSHQYRQQRKVGPAPNGKPKAQT